MDEKPLNVSFTHFSTVIKSCSTDITHLRKLFLKMKEINEQALDLELNALNRRPNQSDKEFEELKEKVKEQMKVGVQIYGATGEQLYTEDESNLKEDKLPVSIDNITINNAFTFKNVFFIDPKNAMRVHLQFQHREIFNVKSETIGLTGNNSEIEIMGQDENWANGARTQLVSIIKEKKNDRYWLHTNIFYVLLVWILLIPFFLWLTDKLNITIASTLAEKPDIFRIAVYIYIFFSILYIGRVLYNYLLWLFPSIEIRLANKKTRAASHRLVVATLFLTAIGAFIYDVLIRPLL